MLSHANAAFPAQTRPEFEIKDSLLADALERNELVLPPRLSNPPPLEQPTKEIMKTPDDHEREVGAR